MRRKQADDIPASHDMLLSGELAILFPSERYRFKAQVRNCIIWGIQNLPQNKKEFLARLQWMDIVEEYEILRRT